MLTVNDFNCYRRIKEGRKLLSFNEAAVACMAGSNA